MPKESASSWSDNIAYLRNFDTNRVMAQQLLRQSQNNIILLSDAFDYMHAVYVDLRPYSKNKKLEETHNLLQEKITEYRNAPITMKKINFRELFKEIDQFFTELTEEAVKRNFYPQKITKKTIDDKINALRLE